MRIKRVDQTVKNLPQQQPAEPSIAKTEEESEDDWGDLFGGFFEETPAENTPDITQQPEPESAKMPFLKPGMNASVQISAVNKIGILTLTTDAPSLICVEGKWSDLLEKMDNLVGHNPLLLGLVVLTR